MGWVSDLISLFDAGDSVVQDFECSHGRVGCGLTPAQFVCAVCAQLRLYL